MGYTGLQGEYIVALENTPELHNVVVCTQCSCTACRCSVCRRIGTKAQNIGRGWLPAQAVLSEMGLELVVLVCGCGKPVLRRATW